ncbi:hypothetical protein [Heyndrickxia vini]|uniref:Lipid II:glycine glycyltransferase n=1 Tax=Heyndrickxia vini TaxID=1476025 RepID=A0ABX7DXL8_9BACI|nr:hypothetical protein [Heyndrickxia vini]QQZ07860.1 hypothetical protein I5776_12240 [Heyndrickxia vini]
MLSVSRKIWGITITQIYFPEESFPFDPSIDVVGITHSTIPMNGLIPIETLQKDLTKDVEELFMDISKSTRKQIKQAQKDPNLKKFILVNPSNEEILQFRDFYNQFAKLKNTYCCTPFHVETLKLLRDQNALIITKIENIDQQPLCYRVYVVNGKRSMPFYSASHYRLTNDSNFKRLTSKAHRMLQWEDMLYFKSKGYQIYDSGGLTNDINIRNFKLEFGGKIITEYSGYLSYTFLGNLVLHVRQWNMSKKSRGVKH